MGIQGLWAHLEKKHGDVFRHANLEAFREKRFAVDVSIYMHKFGHETPSIPPVAQFLEQAAELRASGVEVVYIFDGKRDPAKRYEHERRKVQSEKLEADSVKRAEFVSALDAGLTGEVDATTAPADVRRVLESKPEMITVAGFGEIEVQMDVKAELARIRERHAREKERGGATVSFPDSHYHALMTALDDAGIGYYIAGGDAEQLGAQLTHLDKVDVLVTDDGDALAFGAKCTIRNLFQQGKRGMQQIDMTTVLDALGMTQAQFTDACIMCGSDYTESRGIPSIGPDRAFKIIKKHDSIEAYLASTEWPTKLETIRKKYTDFDVAQFQHTVAKTVFADATPDILYTSKALDPHAAPLTTFERQGPPSEKRIRLEEPVF